MTDGELYELLSGGDRRRRERATSERASAGQRGCRFGRDGNGLHAVFDYQRPRSIEVLRLNL
jgi:hypothetical protein